MSQTWQEDDASEWSRPATASTTAPINVEAEQWPPLPPIPSKEEEAAWRRRSKRRSLLDSLTVTNVDSTFQITEKDGSQVGMARVQSMTSVTATLTDVPTPRARRAPKQDLHADLHWEINALNPRNWSRRRKLLYTSFSAFVAFSFTFAATSMIPAHDDLVARFYVSKVTAMLPTSLYLLGISCGPSLGEVCTRLLSRRVTYLCCLILFSGLTLASALSDSFAGVAISRMLAGVSASPMLHLAWLSLFDLWASRQNIMPVVCYTTMLFLGSTFSFVVEGFTVLEHGWRWSQYVVLMLTAALFLSTMAIKDTSRKTIALRHHLVAIEEHYTERTLGVMLREPFRMLFFEPIVLMYSLFIASLFGISFGLFSSLPFVFAEDYNFNLGLQGVTFIAMSIGVSLGLVAVIFIETRVYRTKVNHYKEEKMKWNDDTLGNSCHPHGRARSVSAVGSEYSRSTTNPRGSRSRRRLSRSRSRSRVARSLSRVFSRGRESTLSTGEEREIRMAVAAARYLNNLKANRAAQITPERILPLLNQQLGYDHLCLTLEGYKLTVDRMELARVLVEASLETSEPPEAITDVPVDLGLPRQTNPLSVNLNHVTNQHRAAAAAALESNAIEAIPPQTPNRSMPVIEARKTWVPPAHVPPPEWRLWGALFASLLTPASLLMLGWTARRGISWIAPVVGMAVFSFSAVLAFVSVELYVLECYGSVHSGSALAAGRFVTCVFGFAFSLFALPLKTAAGTAWAISAYALMSLLFGFVPMILYAAGPRLRKAQRYKDTR